MLREKEEEKIVFYFLVSLYKTRFHASGRRLHIYYNIFACDQMILLCKSFFFFLSLFIPKFLLKFFFTAVLLTLLLYLVIGAIFGGTLAI